MDILDLPDVVLNLRILLQKVTNINAQLGRQLRCAENRIQKLEGENFDLGIKINRLNAEIKMLKINSSLGNELDAFREKARGLP